MMLILPQITGVQAEFWNFMDLLRTNDQRLWYECATFLCCKNQFYFIEAKITGDGRPCVLAQNPNIIENNAQTSLGIINFTFTFELSRNQIFNVSNT